MTPETRFIVGTFAVLYICLISFCVKTRPAAWVRLPYAVRMFAIGLMGFLLWVALMGASDCSDTTGTTVSVQNGHVTQH